METKNVSESNLQFASLPIVVNPSYNCNPAQTDRVNPVPPGGCIRFDGKRPTNIMFFNPNTAPAPVELKITGYTSKMMFQQVLMINPSSTLAVNVNLDLGEAPNGPYYYSFQITNVGQSQINVGITDQVFYL